MAIAKLFAVNANAKKKKESFPRERELAKTSWENSLLTSTNPSYSLNVLVMYYKSRWVSQVYKIIRLGKKRRHYLESISTIAFTNFLFYYTHYVINWFILLQKLQQLAKLPLGGNYSNKSLKTTKNLKMQYKRPSVKTMKVIQRTV